MAYGVILGQTSKQIENPSTIASNVSYNNSQTSSIITGDNVQEAIDELFTSVSNGKELVANAITDKGVVTSATDTFATMAQNITNIQAGKKVNIYSVQEFGGKVTVPNYNENMDVYFFLDYSIIGNFSSSIVGSGNSVSDIYLVYSGSYNNNLYIQTESFSSRFSNGEIIVISPIGLNITYTVITIEN